MSIAAQLRHLEDAYPSPPREQSNVHRLNAEDRSALDRVFSLAPPAFVDAWARALDLSEPDFTSGDRDIFVKAIQGGTSRLKVIDTLYARKWTSVSPLRASGSQHVSHPQGQQVLIENLERFAPDDHVAFVRYAFSQICVRAPAPDELLTLDFDLRRGALDRRAAIKTIVRIAHREGHPALWDSLDLEEDKSDPTCARTLPSGFAYDDQGRESLVFVRKSNDGGWIVAPDLLRQTLTTENGGWLVREGWVLTGPKRSLKPGCWRVDLDIVQHQTVLHLDVVANAGLDVLQQLAICGPFGGSFCVAIGAQHRFVELRLLVRDASGPVWLNPRNISMSRISE